jgi:alkane 1-monooxygenase
MVEALTYYSHYGMIRVPGQRVESRHAWNANAALGNWLMFNIGRHSNHHHDGTIPFWDLKPGLPGEAPVNYPYFAGGLMAFIPPLFHKLMSPRLLKWDEEFASAEEREIAHEQNASSGVAALMAAAEGRQDSAHAPLPAE